MKVLGLDGRTHNLDLTGHVPLGSEQAGSSGHKLARELLTKLFGMDRILEEVMLPGTAKLRADFFLPSRKLVCEIHGRQHYHFVPFYHVTRLGFMMSLKRDQEKKYWCELNSIRYVELPDTESIDEWTVRIRETNVV